MGTTWIQVGMLIIVIKKIRDEVLRNIIFTFPIQLYQFYGYYIIINDNF